MSDEVFIEVGSEADYWSYYSKQAELTQITIFEILELGIEELKLNEFLMTTNNNIKKMKEFEDCLTFDLNILKSISSENYLKHMTLIQLIRKKIENVALVSYENALNKKNSRENFRSTLLEYRSETYEFMQKVSMFINAYLR